MGAGRSGRVLSQGERSRVRSLAAQGLSIEEIARALGRSRQPVSAVVRGVYAAGDGRVSEAERDRMAVLAGERHSIAAIARLMGRPYTTVRRTLGQEYVRVGQRVWCPSPARLSLGEREQILVGLAQARSFSAIAAGLGRATSTVSREVNANGGRDRYRAWRAYNRAGLAARRPKTAKLAACPALAAQVTEWLEQLWSPEKISARLRVEFPDDPMMRVSHETIYQSLYVQGRGELRRELARCLRSGRAARRPRHRLEHNGQIPDMVMISQRPAEVADRAVPGHWEGDLIIGKNGRSAVGTLVERSTRYVMLLALGGPHTAEAVRDAMTASVRRLPAHLVRSITWDQGKEMSQHRAFTVDTGVQIYFCDPHSPWQRGSNENTNGLLRDYMPKGKDLSKLTQDNLDWFAHSLNDRPRQTLDGMKPSEKLAELLALTG
jgi:transposase, IS30 family